MFEPEFFTSAYEQQLPDVRPPPSTPASPPRSGIDEAPIAHIKLTHRAASHHPTRASAGFSPRLSRTSSPPTALRWARLPPSTTTT